jgi:hypothetical protein
MTNYLEMYNWLRGLGFPESYDEYGNLVRQNTYAGSDNEKIFSDGTLMILTSHNNANVRVTFEDMFPIALSDLSFDSTLTDIDYLKATVTFRYKLYTLEKI